MDGMKVVGSTGSPEKDSSIVEELGFDGAWNCKTDPTTDVLTRLAPPLRREPVASSPEELTGHISTVASGKVSQMNFPDEQKYGVKTLVWDKHVLDKYLLSFATDMLTCIGEGKIKTREEVVSGMDNAPAALVKILKGDKFGKMVLRVDSSSSVVYGINSFI
ncbi:putative Enoyl reductase (ER) domain-containing protein [Seiridium unicorne]|uniref:Enoyl reductase (ER) domain-containing protein n=1 Tax=Seiridium unicorne TaxID=138068 RepID=A0ABR2UG45_9PEZI